MSPRASAPEHPLHLFHVGVVAEDIDAAMAEMSASLGVSWLGGEARTFELHLEGELRNLSIRVADTIGQAPHIELIQAIPDTPWAAPAAPGTHHLCYWSEDSRATCAALEAQGLRRVLGAVGSESGYFLTPSGLYIEIISRATRDHTAERLAPQEPVAG